MPNLPVFCSQKGLGQDALNGKLLQVLGHPLNPLCVHILDAALADGFRNGVGHLTSLDDAKFSMTATPVRSAPESASLEAV